MNENLTGKKKQPQKGRGALTNPHNRYAHQRVEEFDDGWHGAEYPADENAPAAETNEDASASTIRTITLIDKGKTIISTNKSPDIPFNKSINPYRGCEHGCIYCYARPTHAYWDMSPGLDFESKIIIKPDAAKLLRETLSKPGYKVSPITVGANTDPYQPLEARLKTTRSIIEVLHEFNHPFSMITKSGLITRDLDLLAPMAEKGLFSAAVSVTTLSNDLKRILEPRATSGKTRLGAIKALTDAGVRVTLMAAPMIPYVNDNELEDILASGSEAGARSAGYILLRLPLEISEMFQDWLHAHFPDRAEKVMSIIRQSRGGKDYQSEFGKRMKGTGEFAELLAQRFKVATRKLGLNQERETGSADAGIKANPEINSKPNSKPDSKPDSKRGTRFDLDTSQFINPYAPDRDQLKLF